MVVELREGDDNVQEEATRMMVFRDRAGASCGHKERRPKISTPTVMSRAWRRMAYIENLGAGMLTRLSRWSWWRSSKGGGVLERE
jgi:hypothetical protein